MPLFKFNQFVLNEALIKDKAIIAKLDRLHALKTRISELTAETKVINTELSGFDADLKPIFDAMKILQDKLATTERYVIKITKYGGTSSNPSYAKAVEQALTLVDETAQAIIKECVATNTSISNVKHSFEIESVQEAKLTDKAKALIAKLSPKIKSIILKLKNFFDTKLAKIDATNAKLQKMIS